MQGPGPSLHVQALAPATTCLDDSELGDTNQDREQKLGPQRPRVYDGSTRRCHLLGEGTTEEEERHHLVP